MQRAIINRLVITTIAVVVVLIVFGALAYLTTIYPVSPLVGWTIIILGVIAFVTPIVWSTVAIKPRWIAAVEQSGAAARAEVLSFDPGMRVGYQGPDFYLTVPVRVTPGAEPAFEAPMTCRLSQCMIFKTGSQVDVKYDPANLRHVVLTGGMPWQVRAG